jgi:hypothetical protein
VEEVAKTKPRSKISVNHRKIPVKEVLRDYAWLDHIYHPCLDMPLLVTKSPKRSGDIHNLEIR